MVTKIAIVGGGTAGWLAANHLAVELRAEAVEITLIESPDVPVIGVGEGTVPHIKQSLKKFGISEADLLASCDCTLKQGIKFQGWNRDSNNYYYHPFSSPFPNGYDATPLLREMSTPFHRVSKSFNLMENSKSPKHKSSGNYEGAVEYAYHFDAKKFGALLAKNAIDRLGVYYKLATIVGATRSAAGEIEQLVTDSGETWGFDFFVDCSGFSALLVAQQLAEPFLDMRSRLVTDTVLARQLPSADTDPIPSYTLAKAHGAGWLWDIPLQSRRGMGYVYASEFLSEEQAAAELAQYCGLSPHEFSYRKIQMKIGYREKFWVKNCAALGLSQGFVEPLEATSILVTDFSAELLARNFVCNKTGWAAAARHCNSVVSYVWQRVIDFVQMHYCISDRRDTDFWRLVTQQAHRSEELNNRLAIWTHRHPVKSDYFSRFDLFDVDNYLYVLYGMGFPTSRKAMTDFERNYLAKEIADQQQQAATLADNLPDHREWLMGFNSAVNCSARGYQG
jgi:tryptophan 7-halogenase